MTYSKKQALLIGCLFFVLIISSVFYFNAQPFFKNPNITSNFCAVMSVIDSGTFQIDRCLETYSNTRDKSIYQGHYYSDKAPGFHFQLMPAAWILRHLVFPYPEYENTLFYLRVFGLSLPAVLFWCLTLSFWRKITGSDASAAALVLAGALGTNALIYSTHLFVHVPAMIFIFFGYWLLRQFSEHSEKVMVFLSGFFIAYAFITDFILFLSVLFLIGCGIFMLRKNPGSVFFFLLGAAIPVIVLGSINLALFHHPFHLAYFYYADPVVAERYQSSIWRFDLLATLSLLWKAWFGPARGMFYVSPFLLLAPLGYFKLWKNPEFKKDVVLCLGIISLNVVMLTKPTTFDGAWAIGMRYLVPSIPFLLIGVGACLRDSAYSWLLRALFKALAIPSILMIGAGAATFPHFLHQFQDPVRQIASTLFRHQIYGKTLLDHYNVHWGALPHVLILGMACFWILFFDVKQWNRPFQKSVVLPGILVAVFFVPFFFFPGGTVLNKAECRAMERILHFMGDPVQVRDVVFCSD